LEYVCLTSFPSCANNGSLIGTPYAYATLTPVCNEACTQMVEFCGPLLEAAGAASLVPDCSATYDSSSVYSGKEIYPDQSWVWNISGTVQDVTCNYVQPPPIECPPYYSYVEDTSVPVVCLPTCPNEVYDDAEYTSQYIITTIGGGGTIIVGTYTLPPLLLVPERWKWPQQMNTWVVLCNFMIGSTYVIPLILNGNDWKTVVCQNDVEYATVWSTPLCAIQGIVTSYFAWAGFMWWFGICVNLAFTIGHLEVHSRLQAYMWHACSWGFALIGLIICIANEQYGGGTGSVTCGYGSSDQEWYFQAVFWIPVGLLWLLGLFALIFVVVQLLRLEGCKGILSQLRLLIFCISSLWPLLYGGAYFYAIIAEQDTVVYNISTWFLCVATATDLSTCDQWRKPPPFGALIISTINTAFFPIFWILIFGLSPQVWKWWKALFVNIYKCNWKQLPNWWTTLDPSSSSSHSSGVGGIRAIRPVNRSRSTNSPSIGRASV